MNKTNLTKIEPIDLKKDLGLTPITSSAAIPTDLKVSVVLLAYKLNEVIEQLNNLTKGVE